MKRSIEFNLESTLAKQCYEQLQAEIIQGVLKPGEKLKVEPIKQRFSIGQAPVREALYKLSAFGLVDVQDNKGFRVTEISEQDIRDTYEVFTNIEVTALLWAIKRGDEDWEANIVAELHKLSLLELSEKNVPTSLWAQKNYDFHVALISGCKSPTLMEIRRHLYMKFDRYCQIAYQLSKQTNHNNHDEHKSLAQAVLQRDIRQVKQLMTEHINEPLEMVIQEFKNHNFF